MTEPQPTWQDIQSNSSGYTIGVRENNGDGAMKQGLIVGTATTGLVRIEWLQARYGQIIPTNWSWVQVWQYMAAGSFMPLGYQVDDAQNLICGIAMQAIMIGCCFMSTIIFPRRMLWCAWVST